MWRNLRPVINESKLTLPPPNLRTTTGILTNSYCPKSRRCHTRSRKNPELQKTGGRAIIPCQVAESTIWGISLGRQTQNHQGGFSTMSRLPQGPARHAQDPHNTHTWKIIQRSRDLGGGNVMISWRWSRRASREAESSDLSPSLNINKPRSSKLVRRWVTYAKVYMVRSI